MCCCMSYTSSERGRNKKAFKCEMSEVQTSGRDLLQLLSSLPSVQSRVPSHFAFFFLMHMLFLHLNVWLVQGIPEIVVWIKKGRILDQVYLSTHLHTLNSYMYQQAVGNVARKHLVWDGLSQPLSWTSYSSRAASKLVPASSWQCFWTWISSHLFSKH